MSKLSDMVTSFQKQFNKSPTPVRYEIGLINPDNPAFTMINVIDENDQILFALFKQSFDELADEAEKRQIQ